MRYSTHIEIFEEPIVALYKHVRLILVFSIDDATDSIDDATDSSLEVIAQSYV
jgi:hypothetical protein